MCACDVAEPETRSSLHNDILQILVNATNIVSVDSIRCDVIIIVCIITSGGQATLSLSGRTVLTDAPVRPSLHQDAYSLVRDAAARADNVGSDEFPTFDYFRSRLLDRATSSAILYDPTRGDHVIGGLVLVTPCAYSRCCQPTVCTITTVTSRDLADDEIWRRDLIDVAMKSAGGRYSACVADVFVTCVRQLVAYRHQGFSYTACIPSAGRLEGMPGYIDNFILYRQLQQQSNLLEPVVDADQTAVDTPSLVDTPGLPRIIILSDGTRLRARQLRHEDIVNFYDTLASVVALDTGGYGVGELLGLNHFTSNYIDGWKNIVFELEATGEIVAYCNSHGPTPFSRSATAPAIVDSGNFVMVEKFRGNKWYYQLVNELVDMTTDDSKVGWQGDSTISTMTSYLIGRRMGALVNGVLPRGIYVRQQDWTDLLLYFKQSINKDRTLFEE